MSGPGDQDSREDHAFFRAIEEAFIRLRGAPLLLSPADWQVARTWRREGIPLELICRALEDFFARRATRGSTSKVQSLRYCRPAVEEAWSELRALGTAAAGEAWSRPLDTAARLRRLAQSVVATLPGADRIAAQVEKLEGEVEAIESRLGELDERLLAAAAESLGEEGRVRIEQRVERGLRKLGPRLEAGTAESVRERLRRQILRRELRLPLLSLFSPEAAEREAAGSESV